MAEKENAAMFRKCTCSAMDGKPHFHIDNYTVIPWDVFADAVDDFQDRSTKMDADDHRRAAEHHDRLQGFDVVDQAFPGPKYVWDDDGDPNLAGCHSGLSVLDYFAGLAMKQILIGPINAPTPQHAAEQAYRYAQAMVAEKRRLEGP